MQSAPVSGRTARAKRQIQATAFILIASTSFHVNHTYQVYILRIAGVSLVTHLPCSPNGTWGVRTLGHRLFSAAGGPYSFPPHPFRFLFYCAVTFSISFPVLVLKLPLLRHIITARNSIASGAFGKLVVYTASPRSRAVRCTDFCSVS